MGLLYLCNKKKNEKKHGPLKGALLDTCTVKEMRYKGIAQALLLSSIQQGNWGLRVCS
jgi:hypothetical protein